jgi:hypothetical protein
VPGQLIREMRSSRLRGNVFVGLPGRRSGSRRYVRSGLAVARQTLTASSDNRFRLAGMTWATR